MINIAEWFSFTRELKAQRDDLRQRVTELEDEKKLLIDALARASNKQAVFNRPEPKPTSNVPGTAFGPTAIAQRRALQEEEEQQRIFERAESARNGNSPAIPEIPST